VLVPASLQQEQGPELRARFLLEAGTCARLRHPNTVTVYDYGSVPAGTGGLVDGALFIAMEYVNGRTLARAIKSDGPFAPARAARIGAPRPRARALGAPWWRVGPPFSVLSLYSRV
jgi:serine/threonine-protein kinase